MRKIILDVYERYINKGSYCDHNHKFISEY